MIHLVGTVNSWYAIIFKKSFQKPNKYIIFGKNVFQKTETKWIQTKCVANLKKLFRPQCRVPNQWRSRVKFFQYGWIEKKYLKKIAFYTHKFISFNFIIEYNASFMKFEAK